MRYHCVLYGATGFSGRLVAQRLKDVGMQVLLAGRDRVRLAALGRSLAMEWHAASLEDGRAVDAALAQAPVVINAAGPLTETAGAMMRACLRTRTHYLDLSGELAVFRQALGHDADARRLGIMLMPGAAYIVAAADCLAHFLGETAPDGATLRLGFQRLAYVSRGTARSMLTVLGQGHVAVGRGKALAHVPVGEQRHGFDFGAGVVACSAVSAPEVLTVGRHTRFREVTAYTPLSDLEDAAYRGAALLPDVVTGFPPFRAALQVLAGLRPEGPSHAERAALRQAIVAEVAPQAGGPVRRWRLVTPDGYSMTPLITAQIARMVAAGAAAIAAGKEDEESRKAAAWVKPGFQTPAGVFGAGLVLGRPDVRLVEIGAASAPAPAGDDMALGVGRSVPVMPEGARPAPPGGRGGSEPVVDVERPKPLPTPSLPRAVGVNLPTYYRDSLHGGLPLPPPYGFEGVHARSFLFNADQAKLQRYCDDMLNIAAATYNGFYFAAMPFAFLTVLHYDKMWSNAPGFRNRGVVSQNELVAGFPVVEFDRSKDRPASPDGVHAPFAFRIALPYILVDNAWSMTTGREILGYPKILGSFSDGPPGAPAKTVQAEVLHTFCEDGTFKPGGIAAFEFEDAGPVAPVAPTLPWPWVHFAPGMAAAAPMAELPMAMQGTQLADRGGEVTGDFESFLMSALPETWSVQLKQFRSVDDSRHAAYQAIARSRYEVTKIRDFRPIFTGGSGKPPTVVLPQYAQMDIAETLGIGVDKGTRIATAIDAFEMTFDMRLTDGQIALRAPDS